MSYRGVEMNARWCWFGITTTDIRGIKRCLLELLPLKKSRGIDWEGLHAGAAQAAPTVDEVMEWGDKLEEGLAVIKRSSINGQGLDVSVEYLHLYDEGFKGSRVEFCHHIGPLKGHGGGKKYTCRIIFDIYPSRVDIWCENLIKEYELLLRRYLDLDYRTFKGMVKLI